MGLQLGQQSLRALPDEDIGWDAGVAGLAQSADFVPQFQRE